MTTPIVDQHEEIRARLEMLRARERLAKLEAAACTCDGGSRLSCPVHREEFIADLRIEAEKCGLALISEPVVRVFDTEWVAAMFQRQASNRFMRDKLVTAGRSIALYLGDDT